MTPPRVSDERLAVLVKFWNDQSQQRTLNEEQQCVLDLRDARAKIVRLNATQEREVRQFNAGHDAAEKHEGPLPRNTFDPSPNDHTGPDGMFEPDEDTWRIGFAFGAYDALAKERDSLAEQVRALRGLLECPASPTSKKHEWRTGEYEDAREKNWCCRCARIAHEIIDAVLAAAPAATERTPLSKEESEARRPVHPTIAVDTLHGAIHKDAATERSAPRTCPECGTAWFEPGEMNAWIAERKTLVEAGVRAGMAIRKGTE